jgi:hypothetical protein
MKGIKISSRDERLLTQKVNPECPLTPENRKWCNIYQGGYCKEDKVCPYRPLKKSKCTKCGEEFISEKRTLNGELRKWCPDCVSKMVVTRQCRYGTATPGKTVSDRLSDYQRMKKSKPI